eukprot:4039165-Prymnesium_polylepis.1
MPMFPSRYARHVLCSIPQQLPTLLCRCCDARNLMTEVEAGDVDALLDELDGLLTDDSPAPPGRPVPPPCEVDTLGSPRRAPTMQRANTFADGRPKAGAADDIDSLLADVCSPTSPPHAPAQPAARASASATYGRGAPTAAVAARPQHRPASCDGCASSLAGARRRVGTAARAACGVPHRPPPLRQRVGAARSRRTRHSHPTSPRLPLPSPRACSCAGSRAELPAECLFAGRRLVRDQVSAAPARRARPLASCCAPPRVCHRNARGAPRAAGASWRVLRTCSAPAYGPPPYRSRRGLARVPY